MRPLLALVAALAALLAPSAAGAAGPILFASDRDGDSDIYSVRPGGTGLTKLTRNRASDHSPAWSPDGRWIAFVSDRGGDEDVYVMRADGTGVRLITRNGAVDLLPAWSPDGRRLGWVSNFRGGQFDVYTVRANGTDRRRLTHTRRANEFGPAWSSDGRRIAFSSDRLGEGNTEIFSVAPDGRELRRLTFTGGDFEFPEDDGLPAYSPDGSRIAFESNRFGSVDLFVMDADGSNVIRLTDTPDADEGEVAWSPDGTRLLFSVLRFDQPFAVERLRLADLARDVLTLGTGPDWRRARR